MSWAVIISGIFGGTLLGGFIAWLRFRCPEPELHVHMPPQFHISSITCAKLDTMTREGQVPASEFDPDLIKAVFPNGPTVTETEGATIYTFSAGGDRPGPHTSIDAAGWCVGPNPCAQCKALVRPRDEDSP